jgi:hypothetical protein
MTDEELYKLLSSKFETAQTDWTGHEKIPKPPYAVYLNSTPGNIAADDKVYISRPRYTVELYTRKQDYVSEGIMEELFDKNDIFWDKDKNWNRELNLFQVVYEI